MRFSLLYIPSYLPEGPDGVATYYREMLKQIEYADQHSWYAAWVSEHHAHSYGGIVPSNVLFGAAVSQRTQRIRIGTAVSVLPLNSPIHLAEQITMLDHLSGGRVEFGIGRGFLLHEHKALAVPVERSWQMFTEAHDIIVKAWESDNFSYHGDVWQFEDSTVLPRPYQRPHPPIWVAASRNRGTFQFAGQHGYGLMLNPYTRTPEEIAEGVQWYTEALSHYGHSLDKRRIASTQHLFVAPTAEEARDKPREALLAYLDAVSGAFAHSVRAGASTQPGAQETISRVSQTVYEDMYPDRVAFGTPNQICQRISELDRLGVTDICFMAHYGDLDWDLSRASVELFTEEVLPCFQPPTTSMSS